MTIVLAAQYYTGYHCVDFTQISNRPLIKCLLAQTHMALLTQDDPKHTGDTTRCVMATVTLVVKGETNWSQCGRDERPNALIY